MTIVSLNEETRVKQRWTKGKTVDWSQVPPPIRRAAEVILEADPDACLTLPTTVTWILDESSVSGLSASER